MTENIFERASREKTRFPFAGMCNVEDLWDLTVRDLDRIFKTLNAKLRTESEESLLDSNEITSELDLQVAIIRHIVRVKIDDANAAEQEATRRQKKDRILSILANKQDESLASCTEEELAKMLEEM